MSNIATGEVTYTYSTTLSQPLEHANGALENSALLTGVTFQVTDKDTDTAQGSFTVAIVDDVPQANDDTWAPTVTGATILTDLLTNDVFGVDGVDTDNAPVPGQVTVTQAGHGTVSYNNNGTFTYTPTDGYNGGDSFTYTIKDSDGDTSTATVSLTVNTNDAPVAVNTENWMPSDPAQQTVGSPGYPNGYPLLVTIPSDADGDNLIVTATGTIPLGVLYFDGTYHALTAGTVLYDPSSGINLLDDLVYTPTAAVTDPINASLSLSISDGTVTTIQTVGIHEVPPTSIPGPTGSINGDANTPLTSGHNAEAGFVLNTEFANAVNNDSSAGSITLQTDFQNRSGYSIPIQAVDQNGDYLEAQVNVYIYVDGIKFQAVSTADGNPNTWSFDGQLMKTVVDFDTIVNTSNSLQTLAQYIALNPVAAGETWTIQYDDIKGGNEQARMLNFSLQVFDPGNPGITVNGDALLADQIYGGSGSDTLSGNGGNDVIVGRGGNDLIDGGAGNDLLIGGLGKDTLTGGTGADTFMIGTGDSTPVISGSGDAGTISGYDTITDWGAGGTADKLDFSVAVIAASATSGFNGTDSALTFGGQTIKSDAISASGIITFDDADTYANALNLNTVGGVAAAVQYLMTNNIGGAGTTVAFVGNGNTYVYEQTTTNAGGTLVQLTGTNITNLNTLITNGAVDPIILDVNHDGFAFSDLNHGVQFDMNGDGTKDQVAWNTSNDGMLAIDLNHDGKIDDGTELFTPAFGGGNFASGAAALASLDSNHDSVIDHNDAVFDSLLIWKDANADGISDAGELSHLADNGIVSISTAATPTVGEIDGQTVTGNGTFQMADGTTGNYVEVELDTSLVAPAEPSVATDGTKTFAIASLDAADLIADFHDGANGDKIDLTALLKGLAGVVDLEAGGFLEIAQSSANAANAEVKVDTDGGGDNYHTVAVLENYTFHSAAEAVKILYDDSHGTKTDVA
ncbi:Ig-like domain-containing protein [Mesorhizobium sp. M0152]|uniref:Ig-like domain-containing protein n=1 Tax=Mesorhizobium sp. M0152 TaxID=2956898 RepID=UPI0033360440